MKDDFDDLYAPSLPAESTVPAPAGGETASLGGALEGADRFNQSNSLWFPQTQSADLEFLPHKELIDNRSRNIKGKDAYTASVVNIHRDSIVGSEYIPTTDPLSKMVDQKLDDGEPGARRNRMAG